MKISKGKMAMVAASLGLALVVGGCTQEKNDSNNDSSSSSGATGRYVPVHNSGVKPSDEGKASTKTGATKGTNGIGATHGTGHVGG
ncbi:MAG: hypothetical protein K0Q56_2470 [Sporolactobacillus laevolacticus]|jgi:hypothetical protein|nr:hypothetical protein [Sporolactobacillus laevolacticus]